MYNIHYLHINIIITYATYDMYHYMYHYYYECILCNVETTYVTFAVVCLNIYMYLQNVRIFNILIGSILLIILNKSLQYCNCRDVEFYETYHPYVHYIAGIYIFYCVWNLNHVTQIM